MTNGIYVLVKLSPNSVSGDSLTIGLIVESSTVQFAKFAKNKISWINRLTGDKFGVLHLIAGEIESFYSSESNRSSAIDRSDKILGLPFFRHLNQSSLNYLQFSEPKSLEIYTLEECWKLYDIYVGDDSFLRHQRQRKKAGIKSIIRKELLPKVSDYLSIQARVTKEIIPELEKSFTFDALGMNGKLISINGIDMEENTESTMRKYQRYQLVWNTLQHISGNSGTGYIVMDVPSKKQGENFLLYDSIMSDKSKLVFSTSNLESLVLKIKDSGAHKLDIKTLSDRNP